MNVVVSLINLCKIHDKVGGYSVLRSSLPLYFVFLFYFGLLEFLTVYLIIQVTVHAMAIKYGGKFVNSFLKGIYL